MAKRKAKPTEPVQYDWKKILNGKLNRLRQGRDFHCAMHTMYNQLRRAAANLDKKVAIVTEDEETYLVQGYRKSGKRPDLKSTAA